MTRLFSRHRSGHISRSSQSAALAQQVKWQDHSLASVGIEQTRLAISDAPTDRTPFSFMVMGDTDAGLQKSRSASNPADFATSFAQQMMAHVSDSRFVLHTGDVTYPDGSFENYLHGFLQPYQALLSQLPSSAAYCADDVVFDLPLLPVLGNHDYAKPSKLAQLWQKLQRLGQDSLRQLLGVDWGRCGGQGGEAYAQTFLDDLASLPADQLKAHLMAHYSAENSAKSPLTTDLPTAHKKYCLDYRPGEFTRLPNRYYSFRYGGIDFFALDSNTWNCPPDAKGFDHEQLAWLEKSLLLSWQDPDSLGRIIYLHHSPYTTEVVRAHQQETLWVRRHLREVFDQVSLSLSLHHRTKATKHALSLLPTQPPVVDLVISGHAHCLEYLKTNNTGHADYHTDWLVCGGSGRGLRAQCADPQILENVFGAGRAETKVVAQSQLYAGVHQQGNVRQKLHSFVRVDICPEAAQLITLRPFVVMLTDGQWETKALAPIHAGRCTATRNISLAV